MRKVSTTVRSILGGLFVGAPAGMAIFTVGNTVNSLLLLPKAIYKTYKMIWKSKWIGSNLKASLSSLVPVGAALVPPTVLVASAIGGMGYGFYKSIPSIPVGVKACFNGVKKLDEFAKAYIDRLDEECQDVDEENVIDIRILESIRGVLCAIALAPIEAIGTTGVLFSKWIPIVYEIYKKLWKGVDSTLVDITFAFALTILFTVSAVLSIPLTPLCTTLFSLGDMCYTGYKFGFVAAGKKCIDRVKEFNSYLNSFLQELRND